MRPDWGGARHRGPAALLAAGITAALLLALNAALPRPQATAAVVERAVTVLLLRDPGPMPAPQREAPVAPVAPATDRPKRATTAAKALSLPSGADALPPALAATAPVAVAAPPPAASAPLRLDEAVLRAAARYSISQARQLAEASGQQLGAGEPLSAQDRLARAAASSAKPDCVASNAGGSLLTIPFIAYDALTGHCK